MNKKLLIVSAIILPLLVINKTINSSPTGAPDGHTGSPADGQTCYTSGCHVGVPTQVTDVITTNVPTEGYTPNTSYNITVTLSGNGNKGFQISPQNNAGQALGTLAAGSGSRVSGSKYITHSNAKSAATATWTFTWTAPAKGTGDVNFYGAFAITRNTTKKQVLTIHEKVGTGINEETEFSASVFPNPVSNELQLKFNSLVKNASITLLDMNGKEVLNQQIANSLASTINVSTLNEGNYIVKLVADNKVFNKKVTITH